MPELPTFQLAVSKPPASQQFSTIKASPDEAEPVSNKLASFLRLKSLERKMRRNRIRDEAYTQRVVYISLESSLFPLEKCGRLAEQFDLRLMQSVKKMPQLDEKLNGSVKRQLETRWKQCHFSSGRCWIVFS